MLDTDLAKALGFEKPAAIRQLIRRHYDALLGFGVLGSAILKSSDPRGRGRPGTAYWLNKEQAAYMVMRCRIERAEAVKVQFVKVFMAWRRGALVQDRSIR